MRVVRVRVGAVVLAAAGVAVLACGSQKAGPEPTGSTHEAAKTPEVVAQAVKAPQAPAAPVPLPGTGTPQGPRFPGIVRTKHDVDTSPPPSRDTMTYFGGQVISGVSIVNVNWSNFVEPTVQTALPQFWQAAVQSDWFAWLSEYGTAGMNGKDGQPGSNQGLYAQGTFQGTYTIAPSICGDGSTCTVVDNEPSSSDIANVLMAQIASGALPPPEVGCDGYVKTLYTIQFPAAVTIELVFAGSPADSCSTFCGYHNWFTMPAADGGPGLRVPYAVLPDMLTGPCKAACGFTPKPLDNYTFVSAHELGEAITDPTVGVNASDSSYARPAAWGGNGGEVGDACSGAPSGTITGSGPDGGTQTWTVTSLWSNAANKCVVTQTPKPICTGQPGDPAGCRVCGCNDVPAGGCSGATPYCETNPSNVDVGACVQCTATSGNCPAGNSCDQSSDPKTDDTCSCGNAGQPCCPGMACNAPNTCGGGGTKNVCGCTPTATCAGLDCGSVNDGCGHILGCGPDGGTNGCTAPQTCGGGGKPNVCGCTPATTCPKGQTCGTAPDGCGGNVNCGTCTAPQTCGGGGVPNECGCHQTVTCPPNANCGTVDDACRGTIQCGKGCTAPASCGGGGQPNVCGCTPLKACPSGKNCGELADGCGGMIDCGKCAAPQSCGGSGTANECGCTPAKSCPSGYACGSAPDGCGGMVTCGTCASGSTCMGNACVGGPADAGQTVDAGQGQDSGIVVVDSGTPADSGVVPDAGEDAGGSVGGGGGSGCNCLTAGASGGNGGRDAGWPALFGGLALVAGLGARRRRAAVERRRD